MTLYFLSQIKADVVKEKRAIYRGIMKSYYMLFIIDIEITRGFSINMVDSTSLELRKTCSRTSWTSKNIMFRTW